MEYWSSSETSLFCAINAIATLMYGMDGVRKSALEFMEGMRGDGDKFELLDKRAVIIQYN